MNSSNSCESDLESVVEAVDSLQSRKAKPDEQKIISYLMKKYRIKTNSAKQLINEALAEGLVVQVNYAESVSFRTPQKLGQMLRNHQNHIIPFDGSLLPINAIKRVTQAINLFFKSMSVNNKLGITLNELLNQLHNTSQMLNYNESLLERLLRHAIKEGYIDRLESGSYALSAQSKQLEGETKLAFKAKNNFKSKMESEKKFESKEENTIPDGASLLVNQSLTAAQKRQKKLSAPVLQRVRPISKRKKFKKSLGPDFLEPQELGMQYLRESFEPKCDICSLTMFSSSTSLNVYEDLLHCNNCDTKAHPSCLNLSEDVAHKTQWQCMNCKICSVCQKSKENEFVIICMTCSKGFHVKCHISPIINKPKGNWYCKSCCTKGTNNLQNGMNDKKVFNSFDDTFENESDAESNVSLNDEKSNEPVLQNDINFEIHEKEKENSEDSSDGRQMNCIEKQENELFVETNESDFFSVNIETSNGTNCINDNINEEINDVENEIFDQITESNELTQSVSLSPQKWTVSDVESYIRNAGFPVESKVFKDQEIDGRSLLLLRRMDVLTGLSLKLGPALKIYNHIMRLQGRDHLNY